ncbi:hypothetical protein [Pseudorhodoferax sp.]|uniref:hypothetical protein n=1 Tax=Pseudorhodoferax sp. TaxID=1993553 RepID=UPI002DD65D10|nr:hypothetical protein [Pseudorhodoferax sp.]
MPPDPAAKDVAMTVQPATLDQLHALPPAQRHRFAIDQLRRLLYSGVLSETSATALVHAMGTMDADLAHIGAKQAQAIATRWQGPDKAPPPQAD